MLFRSERWGFERWRGHDPKKWAAVLAEAEAHEDRPIPPIRGADRDPAQVAAARRNIAASDLPIEVVRAELSAAAAPPEPAGILVVNPPYGERVGAGDDLEALHRELGDVLRRRFLGWTGFVLTTPALAKRIGLRPKRRHILHNGPLECRFLEIPISDRPVERDR